MIKAVGFEAVVLGLTNVFIAADTQILAYFIVKKLLSLALTPVRAAVNLNGGIHYGAVWKKEKGNKKLLLRR